MYLFQRRGMHSSTLCILLSIVPLQYDKKEEGEHRKIRKEKIYEELRIKQREEVNKTSRGGEEVHTRLQCKCYLLR